MVHSVNAEEYLAWKKGWREARLYESLSAGKTRCGVCERRCTIEQGKAGFCRTRMNIEGRLFVLTYGDISTMSENPIEKKPFFNFWPGSKALTVGSYGCNFSCP
jgi:pyruvate formate lyase activating enzyme